MRAWLAVVLILGAWLLPAAQAHAAPGTEIVVVIDTSCSMGSTYKRDGRAIPPSDPDNQALLGALLIEALTRGTDDQLTVVPFHGAAQRDPTPAGLKSLGIHAATPYLPSLRQARQVLEASPRTDRMLVFLSDGGPTDYDDPRQGRSVIGAGRSPAPFDTVVLGLLPEAIPSTDVLDAERYLSALVDDRADYVRVRQASDLVGQFTTAWARALGSKALTGSLQAGESHTFRIGRYVTEVMVVVTGSSPSGPFAASLTTAEGPTAPKVEGDNRCDRCRPPNTHYRVWRLPHDPDTEGEATLTLDRARGDVTYGIILRYDLDARIELPEAPIAGGPATVRASLSWRGQRFDDPRFFTEDDFAAVARVDGTEVVLTHVGGGLFEGDVAVGEEGVGRDVPVTVLFRNAWMEARTTGAMRPIRPPRLSLRAEPDRVDLGTWRGERRPTERCQVVQLVGDRPAGMSLAPTFDGVPDDIVLSAVPLDAEGVPTEDGDSDTWRICATASGCCGDASSSDATRVSFDVDNPAVEGGPVRVAVRFDVAATHWLTCWWPWILGALLVLVLVWLIVGFFRGNDFHPDATVRVAGSERQLPRATAVVLREQPRGRRGFYRSARVCLTSTGEFVASPSKAAVHLEATGSGDARFHLRGPLERKDRRTKRWTRVTEDEALDGPTTGVVYRCGALFLRFD